MKHRIYKHLFQRSVVHYLLPLNSPGRKGKANLKGAEREIKHLAFQRKHNIATILRAQGQHTGKILKHVLMGNC